MAAEEQALSPSVGDPLPSDVLAQLTGSSGWLSSYWPGGGLLVVAATLTAITIWWLRRSHCRSHHSRSRGKRIAGVALTTIAILTTAVLGCAALANAYAGYLPTTAALVNFVGLDTALVDDSARSHQPIGKVQQVVLGDPALRVPPSPIWVYTPAGYDPRSDVRYPVVYLIHGYPGTSADWFRAGRIAGVMDVLVAHHLVPPAIVVAPDLNGGGIQDTEGLDAVHGPHIETWFTRDVVGWADTHLRTVPDRSHRVVGGMSSGGYAALDIALHHTAEFGAVLAQEPYGDPGPAALARLGGDRAALLAHSPLAYLPGMHFARPLAVFLDVGAHDDTRVATRLAAELRADRQPVLFRIEPGQRHTWFEAHAGVPYGLIFAFHELAGQRT